MAMRHRRSMIGVGRRLVIVIRVVVVLVRPEVEVVMVDGVPGCQMVMTEGDALQARRRQPGEGQQYPCGPQKGTEGTSSRAPRQPRHREASALGRISEINGSVSCPVP